tara:strand:- start:38 stop:319 length:282 start_codon:yes stop_codon:yes gene_type:complete
MFEPLNRHLLLEKVEKKEEKSESTILVPDDYKVDKSPYGLYRVKQAAADCEKVKLSSGAEILVNEGMVEEISVGDETYHLILENYVYGLFQED